MSPAELPPAARERIAARARRIALIRRSVVASALAAYALAWGVIAFDGSMGATTASTTASEAESASASTTVSPSVEDSSSDDAAAVEDAPVTTAQS